ncbi:hypothetical protein R1flu_012986 [Riccia fluitans]|uniref:Saccharopine dehydrogenase (NAD(+), L-glutamate-forming) n=1 Tax=Riccia fluitans TaxID=41844 RepID=A0ABD1ZDF1_9MARC
MSQAGLNFLAIMTSDNHVGENGGRELKLDTFSRGNGVVGIRREEHSKWERRAPLTPAHCARLLHSGRQRGGVSRIIVQPCTKRIHSDQQYQDVGCEISENLSDCGLILGVKRPQLGTLLPRRSYAFFSHTHKAQPENMALLDEILEKRVSLYDYELIVGENKERLVAFGEYAGKAGMIDFFRGLGERFLSLGFSTPFLSVGSSYMYSSLSTAKAAVMAAGDEIANNGLALGICPLVFVFTGAGNVSRGAQEIFRLLPHTFVKPSELPRLFDGSFIDDILLKKRKPNFQVFGCVVEARDMVVPNDPSRMFDKTEYYSHPELYHSSFHETIAPYTSALVNCMYWERRFPRLLDNEQLRELAKTTTNTTGQRKQAKFLGVADITCDIGGSIECLHQATSIEHPFFRYDPLSDTYHDDMDGDGVIILAVDCLPTELAKEATKHFGDVLLPFITNMAHAQTPDDMLHPIRRACIAHNGDLTPLYEYIQVLRGGETKNLQTSPKLNHQKNGSLTRVISLNGHLFDQFLINEALDLILEAGGRFRSTTCRVGHSDDEPSHAALEVEADSEKILDQIVDSLAAIASHEESSSNKNCIRARSPERSVYLASKSLRIMNSNSEDVSKVLILGAGRMCEPAVKYLASQGNVFPPDDSPAQDGLNVHVIVASLFLRDAQKVTAGVPNAFPLQLDISDYALLRTCISKADVVISLLPPDCHIPTAKACIELKKNLVTASYVSPDMDALHEKAKEAGIVILCEMGLDPGIDHMMAMQMINVAHTKGGYVRSFISYCGGLPSPMAANNPLGYKFSWNPAGAIKAGRNPAIYKFDDKIIEVPGNDLFSSAVRLRLPNLPAFALERLPNRDSLKYGELYNIAEESSTVFRATLRYEGFSEIMAGIAKLGFFDYARHQLLGSSSERTVYSVFLNELLSKLAYETKPEATELSPKNFLDLGCSTDVEAARRLCHCLRWLGLDSKLEIPETCKSAFDVLCSRMEAKLTFTPKEQDLVLLHHELDIAYKDGRPTERHTATLLAVGESVDNCRPLGEPQTAMARTVGLTAAIGAQLLLFNRLKSRGVVRPLQAEVYDPALKILAAQGMQFEESCDLI